MISSIMELRKLNNIERFSIMRVNKRDSVAEHSFFVMMIAMHLNRAGNLECDIDKLVNYAMFHDIEEAYTNDIPWSLKKHEGFSMSLQYTCEKELRDKFRDMDSLSEAAFEWWNEYNNSKCIEARLVKCADMMEFLVYCLSEVESGNTNINEEIDNAIQCLYQSDILVVKNLTKELENEIQSYQATI